ncbi:hypothetical protein [Staphylococcus auricularis]|uniref:IS30 family transposase n=1 Tax=Staphylococcus auricularis TaxID=29379 RepID=A0AAW7MDN5_9STAP|nr:hypothetical protein [Staphylococcus auricularis]MDC6327179.1 hypothetical protein [Staphylococcus auricularis]MDN4533111.1 hypothetical protein [Staphylococcus auricularis]MDN4533387.1 hypothetical protein [Staphylococcus auricularis]
MKTRNIDLLQKLSRKDKSTVIHHRSNKRILGPSISKWPKSIQARTSFGHWEIDTFIGTKNKTCDFNPDKTSYSIREAYVD